MATSSEKLAQAVNEFRRALILAKQQSFDEAIAGLRRAVALAPRFAEAHYNLGTLAAMQGAYEEAADCFRRAVDVDPGNAVAHYNLGLARQHQGRPAEAEPHYRHALRLSPRHAPAHNQLGMVLQEQRRFAEAEACYGRALECAPDYVDAEHNLSGLLLDQSRFDEAEERARRVLRVKPDFAAAQYNLGVALAGELKDESIAVFRRVIELEPANVDAHLGLAGALLARGRFAEGWLEYEWRLKSPHAPADTTTQPRWGGEALGSRTILLRAEQGFGDAIQFVRYAELVKGRGGTVKVACTSPVRSLLATCAGVEAVVARDEPPGPFDVYAPLLSLPGVFQTSLDTIPAKVPYLFPDPATVAQWQAELGREAGLKIGIAWQGNPQQPRDAQRSFPLAHFARIARFLGVRLYSLQMGDGCEQAAGIDWPLVDWGDRLGDFHRTAALVQNLDLVITCDSAPAHLAGALGVPVWVALAHQPDWRWLLDRADSPWYPTMRLFRQPRTGDWDAVFAEIERALGEILPGRG
jgi:tetratricopeptide (TPR) repeat protein